MDQWLYDPAVAPTATVADALPASGPVVRGVRSLAAVVLRTWLRVYHRATVVGREHLPVNRSFLLVSNHSSHLDAVCLLAALPLRQLHRAYPMAARDYFFARPRLALLATVVFNALPVDRRFAPWECLDDCGRLLRSPGNVVIFFPEGTRANRCEPGAFKPGVGLLAAGRDLPVVPCHLSGTHAALPKGCWFPRPHSVHLTIGEPRVYAHLPPTKEAARHIGRDLRAAVIALGRRATPETTP